jgi:aryl carrier-like protein
VPADAGFGAAPGSEDVRAELLRLWADTVGTADDDSHFFRLGGTSLQALRLLAAIRSRFGITVRFATLLEHPSPAALAALITQLAGDAGARAAGTYAGPRLHHDPRREVAPLTVMQADRLRKDEHYLQQGRRPPPHHVGAALRLTGQLDVPAFNRALRQVHQRHPSLRLVFETTGGSWQQRILPPAAVPVSLRWYEVDDTDLPWFLGRLYGEPFDLGQGPPVRVDLVRVGEHDHVLLLVLEHLVADGTSLQVLLEDFATAYRTGQCEAPEPKLTFLDYAHAESEWLTEHGGQPCFAYWQEAMDGRTGLPYCEIPLGDPVERGSTGPARVESVRLDPGLTTRLDEVAERAGASWFTLIAAAAHLAVAEVTDLEGVATVSPVANRHRAGTERTVGWFANLVALATTAAERETADGLLDTLRRRQLDALDNSELPFWHLMERVFGHDSRREPDSSWIYVDVETAASAGAPSVRTGWPGLRVQPTSVSTELAGRGLDISATVGSGGVDLHIMGRGDRFSGGDLARVRSAVVGALESLAAGGAKASRRGE